MKFLGESRAGEGDDGCHHPAAPRLVGVARDNTVILTEHDINASNVTVQIPKEWQPVTGNDRVE